MLMSRRFERDKFSQPDNKPEEPKPMPEKERLAYRKTAKARAAEFRLLEQDRKRAEDYAVGLERQLDELAAKHVEDCRPLQEELRQIESSRIQETIDRQPSDPAREERRQTLISTLAAMNDTLEKSLARVREKLPAASQALMEATTRLGGGSYQTEINKLVMYGPPELVEQLFVNENARTWAVQRVDAARRALREAPGELAKKRIQVELSAALAYHGGLETENERLRQLCIDE